MNKKAQMEIMGLAIIAVLIVMGMLFAVRFMLFKDEETIRKDYLDTQLAANTLNTLLLTNTECLGVSIAELLEDASKTNPSISCGSANQPSRDYAAQTIKTLLDFTLKSVNKDYYFRASATSKGELVKIVYYKNNPSSTERDNKRERQTKTHFLPGASIGDTITIVLDIYS